MELRRHSRRMPSRPLTWIATVRDRPREWGFNCFIWRSLHRTVTYRVLDLRACLAVLLSTAAGATRSPSDVRGASDNEKAGVPCSWGRAIPQVLGPVVGADPYCSGAEEGQHGQDAAVVVGGVVQAELGEHPADVG